ESPPHAPLWYGKSPASPRTRLSPGRRDHRVETAPADDLSHRRFRAPCRHCDGCGRERRLGPRTARHRTTGRSTRLRVHGSPNPTWSYLSHSCASKGKGAMAVTASPERFRQEDAAGARWIARNGPENAVSVALVETGRLEADRVEERRRAAAPARLVLGE